MISSDEPVNLLPCSQELAEERYFKPDGHNPHPHTLFYKDSFIIILFSYLFLSDFRIKIVYVFLVYHVVFICLTFLCSFT
jgi:hypothetical protein